MRKLGIMTTATQIPATKHELSSEETWEEFVELTRQVSEIPIEQYWEWLETPEGKSALVDLIAGTMGDALKELAKH